jgi:hypothetical protein
VGVDQIRTRLISCSMWAPKRKLSKCRPTQR